MTDEDDTEMGEIVISFPEEHYSDPPLITPQRINQTFHFSVELHYKGEKSDRPKCTNVSKWRSLVSSSIVVAAANPVMCDRHESRKSKTVANGSVKCQPLMTCTDDLKQECKPKFTVGTPSFVDELTYSIPIAMVMDCIPGSCKEIEILVTVTIPSYKDKSSCHKWKQVEMKECKYTDPVIDQCKKAAVTKTISKVITLKKLPLMMFKHLVVCGNHLVSLTVENPCCESILVQGCDIFSHSTITSSQNKTPLLPELFIHENSRAIFSLIPKESQSFPVSLEMHETITLLYNFYPKELSFHDKIMVLPLIAFLKWSSVDDSGSVITSFSLPSLRLRNAPFTVSTSSEGQIGRKKSFTVNYTLVNKLQDFLGVRFYWTPEILLQNQPSQGADDKYKYERLRKSVVCHDPYFDSGSSLCGSSSSVNVGFELLRDGVYELGKFMKINLRYALDNTPTSPQPGASSSTSVSSDTTSTLSADQEDPQLEASEELWNYRQSSTNSLQNDDSLSAELKRKTFATKSYSFGNLGPTRSADSDVAQRKFKIIERSPSVLPGSVRLQPPQRLQSQDPAASINPENFLKKSCQVYLISDTQHP